MTATQAPPAAKRRHEFILGMLALALWHAVIVLAFLWLRGLHGLEAGLAGGVALLGLGYFGFRQIEKQDALATRFMGLPREPWQTPSISGALFAVLGIGWPLLRASLATRAEHVALKKQAEAAGRNLHDSTRELVETIVFVAVLVLMLKLFVVEAFVIPTGSMAETLYGYHKVATCEQCGYQFPVNTTSEVEPDENRRLLPVVGYCCPNCYYRGTFKNPANGGEVPITGDRVLVHKAMSTDERGHVVVFKYPVDPQKRQVAQNYIKRAMAFGGETLVLYRGDIYITRCLKHPAPEGVDARDAWQAVHMHRGDVAAHERFFADLKAAFQDPEGFQLFRKPDDIAMEMRRIVYDNDFQPQDLAAINFPPRWSSEGPGWSSDKPAAPRTFRHTGSELHWLRYRHTLPIRDPGDKSSDAEGIVEFRDLPQLGPRKGMVAAKDSVITNFLGYNNGLAGEPNKWEIPKSADDSRTATTIRQDPVYWVGDLMLECRVKLEEPGAEFVLELSKGRNRFQAVFAQGEVTLVRTGPEGKRMGARPSGITKPGQYQVRFTNFDCRLSVWVNDTKIDFGTEGDYTPLPLPDDNLVDPKDRYREGWTQDNDLKAPASIAAKGQITVSQLKLWRDTYHAPNNTRVGNVSDSIESYYVQPGHYLCLGDNSTQSSDGREWGLVPERLMLGRAVLVFWPIPRIGFIK